jgi:hypothetical protein
MTYKTLKNTISLSIEERIAQLEKMPGYKVINKAIEYGIAITTPNGLKIGLDWNHLIRPIAESEAAREKNYLELIAKAKKLGIDWDYTTLDVAGLITAIAEAKKVTISCTPEEIMTRLFYPEGFCMPINPPLAH